jgi:hypothetical protein
LLPLRKSHPQGLATLSVAFKLTSTPGGLFQPPTLLGFALQSFPPLRGSNHTFPHRSSALALPCQTRSAWHRSSSGLLPPEKPCPLLRPGWFRSGRGLCSPGPFDLSGSPSPTTRPKVSLFRSPLASFPKCRPYDQLPAEPQGFRAVRAWLSPSVEGAGPSGLSHRRSCATF